MSGTALPWPTLVQCLVAGVVIGLCAMHAGWWRDGLRRTEATWTLAWSASLAGVSLVNGLAGAVPPGAATSGLLFARHVLIGAAITLSLPAVRAFTGARGIRWLVVGVSTWYAAGAVLWLSTDLVYAHRIVDGLPQYGPLAPAASLLPLLVVAVYVMRAVRGMTLTIVGAVVVVTGTVSTMLLVLSAVPPPSAFTELLMGVWALPLVLGLQVVAAARIGAVRREGDRRAAMRDALASVSNAAWLAKTPEQILERACDEARSLLADPSIEGTLRPLARHRFITEFYSVAGRTLDADEAAFLRDLARMVSGSAERQALTTRLRRAAYTDSLTDLHNRHALDRYLAAALEKANVERSRVAVLFCDLDGFKLANDRHGHEWGDSLLVLVAGHLHAVLGPDAYVARHGGDEFVAVVERAPDAAALRALARRIRDEFESPGDDVVRTALTVGISVWSPGDIVDPSALVREADLAMLEGKRSHVGVAMYDARLRARVTAVTTARRDLEAGVRDGQIIAHFQPLTDALTLEVVGLEVLARWRRDGRLRRPADWLPMAEDSGLIVEIGRQMFAAARRGMERFDLPVAVNVAARQLDEPDFVAHVEEAWGTTDWDRLTIEVTESALLYDAAHVRASLATLVDRGVRIALDDFGTGYNSLSRLGELPLHVLKIDRTFVHDIGTTEGAAVLRAILALAEAHGLEVVAEGVERAEELTALVEMGVATVQGHMLGRPAANLPVRGRRPRAVPRPTRPTLFESLPSVLVRS